MRRSNALTGGVRAAGFTLIEIAVVIVVLSLLLAMIAGLGTAMVGQQRREATRQKLAGVETALALFASQNRRLPCPANGTLAGTDANAGREDPDPPTGACANNQANGVVPWRALGLAEQDITDGWGNRMTYRVSTDFIVAGSMNFTRCDPAGTAIRNSTLDPASGWCLNTSSPAPSFTPSEWTDPKDVTRDRGLPVQNLAGAVTMNPNAPVSTGAAYVVISHGENRKGAYNSQGKLYGEAWRGGWEDEERKNDASLALATHYVDDFFTNDDLTTTYFDDFVLRPTILTVATRAQLGPRAH